MKAKFLSAICLLLIGVGCQSDIEKELTEAPLSQENIHNILDEASTLKEVNPALSLENAQKGLTLSKSINYANGELRAYSILSALYMYQFNDLNKSHYYLEEYGKVMKQKESQIDLSRYYYNKGVAYYNEKKFTESYRFLIKAKALYEELGNNKGLSNTYYTLGLIRSETFQYDEAKSHFEKSRQLASEAKYDLIEIASLEQYGNILLWEGNFRKANEYFKKSTSLALEVNDLENVADGLNVTGYCLIRLGHYSDAQHTLSEARRYAEKANSDIEKGNLNLYLSYLEGTKGNHETGRSYLDNAVKIFQSLDMQDKLMEVYGQMAWHNTNLGDLEEAKASIEKGLTYIQSARKIDTDQFFVYAYEVAKATGSQADTYRYKYEQANLELDRRRKNDMAGMMKVQAEHEEAIAANKLELDKAALALEQAQVEKLNLTRGMVVAFILLLVVAGASLSIGFINNFRASNDLRKLSKDFLNNSSEILQKYGASNRR
ncbi:tetratricopeptide repeat protein [Roseivirga sp. BDSF3-8]|uniref:tetratricopeptide repeat protein n=1 Tax=Roseivirga sp. BDSF3-8 TaxID=3241598 RepID=UPI0035325B88